MLFPTAARGPNGFDAAVIFESIVSNAVLPGIGTGFGR